MMQVLKSVRVFAVLAAMLATLVFAVSAVAAGPSDSTISISPTATLVTAADIDVQVTYTCPPTSYGGTSGYLYVQVDQPQTGSGSGIAFTSATCDGTSHKETLAVSGGPFVVGDANAVAQVSSFTGAQTNREIHIR